MAEVMGIDIGGTGIKGAPVNVETGELLAERMRILTPQPATPEACAKCIAEIIKAFDWKGTVGCGYPGVIKQGHTMTAANLDKSWIGLDAKTLIEAETGCPVTLINDADAAGLAEMRFGAGRDNSGVVMMITIGTGIGTALFTNGILLPNTEFGHLLIRGRDAEHRASERVRIKKKLSWKQWAQRVDEYLHYMENLFWPDLIIIGGGVSKKANKFFPYLTIRTPIVPAELLNEAGIVGAAMATVQQVLRQFT